ncbi:nucleoside transporter-domain-containing protein [Schizophyllum fasciatum]
MSPSSTDALYHPIPQGPVAANPILHSDSRIDNIDEEEVEDILAEQDHGQRPTVDARLWWINCLLGCAVLLPWNAIITATPYFLSRLQGSTLQKTFSSYLSTSFTASNFFFLACATARSKRIFVTLIGLAILSAFLSISTFIRIPPGLFFACVLLNAIIQAGLGSFLQTSAIAVASLFGPPAVQAMMAGQAAIAVAISTVQVISATLSVWAHKDSATVTSDGSAEARSAFVFFSLSALYLLLVAAAHAWMVAQPEYRSVTAALEPSHKANGSADERRALVSSGPTGQSGSAQIWRVAKSNALYEIAVSYVFAVTLSVFPPITISVQPVNPSFHPLLFSAVHFLMFGLGDLTGRYLLSYPRLIIWDARRLLSLSLARTLFIPLFLLCNVQTSSAALPATPLINSDFLFMLLLFLFALSNGFVSSGCMMAAPSLEHNPRLKGRKEDVDVAATVASFCLVGGLAVGSIASFVVRGAICACNPFRE